MTEQEKQELYQLFLDTWGTDSQVHMAIEEMSELTKELCKTYRPDIEDKTKIYNNVREEIADVCNMMEQMKVIFGKEEIEAIQDQKLIRTKKIVQKD